MHDVTYEQMLIQLRSNFQEKSAAIMDLRAELVEAISAKQQELKPGINADIRTHNSHKILISRAMHALEILALSAGD